MSGAIRRFLGPAKSRLKTYLEPESEPSSPRSIESEDRLQEVKNQKLFLFEKLRKTIASIKDQNAQWNSLFSHLEGQALEAEEARHSEVFDGPSGITTMLLDADERMAQLEVEIRELERQITQPKLVQPTERIEPESPFTRPPVLQAGHSAIPDSWESNLMSPQYTVPPQYAMPQQAPSFPMLLEKKKLEEFDGDYLKYPGWWQMFRYSVHDLNIPNMQKFTYLKPLLTGRAAKAIEGIAVRAELYPKAIQKLKERFDDPKAFKLSLYNKLKHLDIKSSNTRDLREGVETLEWIVRQLESVDEDVEQPFLKQQLLEKIPVQTMLALEDRKSREEEWTVELLFRELWAYIKPREFIQNQNASEPRDRNNYQRGDQRGYHYNNPPNFNRSGYGGFNQGFNRQRGSSIYQQQRPIGSTGSFNNVTRPYQNKAKGRQQFQHVTATPENKLGWPRSPCVFCSGDHFNDMCDVYKTLEQRKQRLSNLNRCFHCLKTGHPSFNCPATKRACFHCQGFTHSRFLCIKFINSLINKNNSGNSNSPQNQKQPHKYYAHKTRSNAVTDSNACQVDLTTPSFPMQLPDTKETKGTGAVHTQSHCTKETICFRQDCHICKSFKTSKQSMLLTAEAFIRHPETQKLHKVHVFLDCGSQKSYILDSVVQNLEIPADGEQMLQIHTFAKEEPQRILSQLIEFELVSQNGSSLSIVANSVPYLTGDIQRGPLNSADCNRIQQLPQSAFADVIPYQKQTCKPEILLGLDFFFHLLDCKFKQQLPSGLFLVSSHFGILIGGKDNTEILETNSDTDLFIQTEMIQTVCHLNLFSSADTPHLKSPNCQDYWDLERIGICDAPDVNEDDEALNQFYQSLEYRDGRYYIDWPYNSNIDELPTNQELALARFKSLLRRLQCDELLREAMFKVIEDQDSKSIVETVENPENAENVSNQRVHMLPYQPVLSSSKTTKCRIVYDASSKSKKSKRSLNECLHRGPILLANLVGLLLRFLLLPVAILADIEKAFLQIGLIEAARDVTRFYWLKDTRNLEFDPSNIIVKRFKRLPFGAKSSPFILAATIDYHCSKYQTPVSENIRRNLYVDNLITCVNSSQDAIAYYKEAKNIFMTAKMNLREWVSNDKNFMNEIKSEDKVQQENVKVLGLRWNTSSDVLSIPSVKEDIFTRVRTKRDVLQALSSIFDPLGFFSPIVVGPKLLLQKLWKASIEWDDPMPEQYAREWKQFVPDLTKIQTFAIPRYTSNPEVQETRLLCFCDSSSQAFTANVYLHEVDASNNYSNRLLMSKSRLSQKKGMTIPRLELLAVFIGCKLLKFVATEIDRKILKFTLWTDSSCVLDWIQSRKKLPVFVQNRIEEIRSSEQISFCFIPGEQNPADFATRPHTWDEFMENETWWTGPLWLNTNPESWPLFNKPEISPETLAKLDSSCAENDSLYALYNKHQAEDLPQNNIEQLIQINNYSSFMKLLRVTAYVFRFLTQITKNSKLSVFQNFGCEKPNQHRAANYSEINRAKLYWIDICQNQHFPDVFESLKSKKPINMVKQLGIFQDANDLLRCQGRLTNSELPWNAKYPLLLPKSSPLTNLIIQDIHQNLFHAGVQTTLATVRQEYWIPQGRSVIQKVISKCVVCKKFSGGPFTLPPMPPLPSTRVTHARPFEFVGIDYCGPLTIKSLDNCLKVWICLFVCFVTRNIHLEPVTSLTSRGFLFCLRRFISRRGRPTSIVSDNAAHFKLSKSALDQAFYESLIADDSISYCSKNQISWRFITELAPWQGGHYERMVGLTKSSLKKAIGRAMLNFEELLTYLCECESILNSRPLTFLHSDINSQSILRPIDLLVSQGEIGTETLEENHDDPAYIPSLDSTGKLVKFWKSSQKHIDKFWKLWQSEYIPSLRERFQTSHKSPRVHSTRPPKVGEIVLLHEENIPRGSWRLGRIINLIPSSTDSQIRTAEVLTANKNTLKRPINLLYPLEVQSNEKCETTEYEQPSTTELSPETSETTSNLPRYFLRSSLQKFNTTVITSIVLMLMFVPRVYTSECPANAFLTKVNSRNCVSEGIVVMRQNDSSLCWMKKTCPTGHLDGKGSCGVKCKCPSWAQECSFYEGKEPPVFGIKLAILSHSKPAFCSQRPNPACHEEPTIAKIPQIELYDGTKHVVRKLEIEIQEATSDEYVCIGQGEKIGGTPAYCQTHPNPPCHEHPTRFCYYVKNDIAYFVSDQGKLPIKKWGYVPFKFYGPKKIRPYTKTCTDCFLTCIQGGVEVHISGAVNMIEVCSHPFCYKVSHPYAVSSINFPAQVSVSTHDFNAKIWSNGFLIEDFGIQCPPAPFCEQIDCMFCWSRLANPQCMSKYLFLLLFIAIYFSSTTLLLCLKFTRCGTKLCYYVTLGIWEIMKTVYNGILKVKSAIVRRFFSHNKLNQENSQANTSISYENESETSEDSPSPSHKRDSKRIIFTKQKPPKSAVMLTAILTMMWLTVVEANPTTNKWILFEAFSELISEIPNVYLDRHDGFYHIIEYIPQDVESILRQFPVETSNVIVCIQGHEYHLLFICWWIAVFGSCLKSCLSCKNFKPKSIYQALTCRNPSCTAYGAVRRAIDHNLITKPELVCQDIEDEVEAPNQKKMSAFFLTEEMFPTDPTVAATTRRDAMGSATILRRSLRQLMNRTSQLLLVVAIFETLCQLQVTNGCAEVATLTADQSICTQQDKGTLECILTSVTRLAFAPQGQESCLLVKDPNGYPMGTLALTVNKIVIECNMKNEYFLRSFKMNVESKKRCAKAGSCKGTKCDAVKYDTKIPELPEANKYPGYTFCSESCGCAGCHCFFCEYACLFYRIYATPTSNTIYEMFSCPSWNYRVDAVARLTLHETTESHTFTLRPGQVTEWNNIRMTLVSITAPPAPLLNTYFLTDGLQTVLVQASHSGQAIAGTIGQYQCSNRENARNFKCNLPRDICTCQPHGERVACQCYENSLEDLFYSRRYLIPLSTSGITLNGQGTDIYAEYANVASLELQISLEGLQLHTKIDKNTCKINVISFEGCYSCLVGAKLHYKCTTDFGQAESHLTCGKAISSAICSETGTKGVATLHFDKAYIEEVCTAECPAGKTQFQIKSSLIFINKDPLVNISNLIAEDGKNVGGVDFGFLASILSGNWLAALGVIIAIIIAVAISIPLLPVILSFIINTISSCFQSIKKQISNRVGKASVQTKRNNKPIFSKFSKKKV